MFNTPKFGLFVVLGLVFWFLALLFVRLAGTSIFSLGNPALPVLYVLAYPVLWGAVWLSSAISRVPLKDMVAPVVIMTVTAMVMDGLAIGFFPQAYGDTHTHVMLGAAFILWGAAGGIICAWVTSAYLKRTTAQ